MFPRTEEDQSRVERVAHLSERSQEGAEEHSRSGESLKAGAQHGPF